MAEQALYAYPCADWAANGVDLRRTAGLTPYQHTLGLLGGTCDNLYLGYSSDAGQRLTTKSQGHQHGQIIDRADLAGRKSLQRQRGILGGHAAAVIRDLDEASPAIDQFNVNTRAASIEGIVEEFLQH